MLIEKVFMLVFLSKLLHLKYYSSVIFTVLDVILCYQSKLTLITV